MLSSKEKFKELSFMSVRAASRREGFETKSGKAKNSNRHHPKPEQVASIEAIQQSLVKHFEDIKHPRVERTKKHQLTDILVIAILAVIGGAQGWEDIENYGISKQQSVDRKVLRSPKNSSI
jgi:hypothetical protein